MAFGPHRVLRGVDLRLEPGETVALLGDNGSGKTTLARILAGLLRPTRGRVTRRTDVGLTPPNPAENLFCDSVEEEITFGPSNFGVPVPEGLLAALRIDGLEKRRPTALSLGQQQRLSVAATLAARPGLLILDEPTIGQDRFALDALFDGLRRLAERGVATLLVTHDEAMSRRYATRTLRLEGGKLLA